MDNQQHAVDSASPVATVSSAALVCRQYAPSDEALGLLAPGQSPWAFVDALLAHERHEDAIEFVARWLDKRRAVWWGCLAVWCGTRHEPPPAVDAALAAAVAWVREPGEVTRRMAQDAAAGLGAAEPAGALARAVFWSGGSISRPDLPAVEPRPDGTAQTVAALVRAVALRGKPQFVVDRRRQLLRIALEVVRGELPWDDGLPAELAVEPGTAPATAPTTAAAATGGAARAGSSPSMVP